MELSTSAKLDTNIFAHCASAASAWCGGGSFVLDNDELSPPAAEPWSGRTIGPNERNCKNKDETKIFAEKNTGRR